MFYCLANRLKTIKKSKEKRLNLSTKPLINIVNKKAL